MKINKSEYVPVNSGDFEFRDSSKHSLSKFEHDLYKEEDDTVNKVIRVKRISLPNKGENWKVFEDNKVVEVIEGTRLSGREREFLRTIQGINFILRHFKGGWKSFNHFKKELKTYVK